MNFTFYRLIKMLLVSLNREQIFLRSARSLGHAYKEVDILQYHGMADLESKDMLPLEASSVKAMEKLPQNISSKMHTESFVEVFSYFFGLLGQSSPLPYYLFLIFLIIISYGYFMIAYHLEVIIAHLRQILAIEFLLYC